MAIDDVVKRKSNEQQADKNTGSHANSSTLESRIHSVGKALMTGSIVAGAYGLVGKSSLLTAGGNAIGYLIEKIKGKGKQEKIQDIVKEEEIHKEIRTGGIMGTLGYALYSLIDFIPNYTSPLKILKTIAFNPIMLAPYVAFYQAFTYLRDNVGTGKTILGFFNLKIFKYMKDAYYNKIKPNFKKSMKKIMYLIPIHFASINYVKEVWKRVGIGVFNDIAFRLFQSKKPSDYSGAKYN